MAESERQTQKRKFVIKDRVFKAEDLRRIARIFDDQKPTASTDVEYEADFADLSSFESSSSNLFSDESLTTAARATAIRMSSRDYTLNRYIRFSITQGYEGWGNEAEVGGTDLAWVRATFTALREEIEKVASQNIWLRRYNPVLVVLILVFILVGLVAFIAWLARGLCIMFHVTRLDLRHWISVWLVVFAVTGVSIVMWTREWLLSAWPSIEFDFGPDHLKHGAIQRRKIKNFMIFLLIPLIMGVLAELIGKILL